MKRIASAVFLTWTMAGGAAPEADTPRAASPPVECRATFVIG